MFGYLIDTAVVYRAECNTRVFSLNSCRNWSRPRWFFHACAEIERVQYGDSINSGQLPTASLFRVNKNMHKHPLTLVHWGHANPQEVGGLSQGETQWGASVLFPLCGMYTDGKVHTQTNTRVYMLYSRTPHWRHASPPPRAERRHKAHEAQFSQSARLVHPSPKASEGQRHIPQACSHWDVKVHVCERKERERETGRMPFCSGSQGSVMENKDHGRGVEDWKWTGLCSMLIVAIVVSCSSLVLTRKKDEGML